MQPPTPPNQQNTTQYGTFATFSVESPPQTSSGFTQWMHQVCVRVSSLFPTTSPAKRKESSPSLHTTTPQLMMSTQERAQCLVDRAVEIADEDALLPIAIQFLEAANELDPGKPHILTLLGDLNVLYNSGYKQATKCYRQALAIDPHYAKAQLGLEMLR